MQADEKLGGDVAESKAPVAPGEVQGSRPAVAAPQVAGASREEYVVELLIVVEAHSRTDAEVLGKRAAKEAWKAQTPRSAGVARIVNVIVADVRSEDDDADA